jgi:signal transduction histidine kinase
MVAKKKVVRIALQKTVDSVLIHDMKNLAFRLSALLQNMEENYDTPLFKQSMSEILSDTVRKVDGIVNRFRQSQEQVVIMKLKVDINQILTKVIQDLPLRRMRGVETLISFNEVPLIWGDPFYLHNAFRSISENSLDAMPKGGAFFIGTGMITSRGKKRIRVQISDTGQGMTEAFIKDCLFSAFNTTKESGLGLGLFTCKQIIALHHGKIKVASAPGVGTTFEILLPVEDNG